MVIVAGVIKMAFHQLPQRQKDLIYECMVAIAQGPFLEEWEFQTRTGITRAELETVIARWPNYDDVAGETIQTLAINNCLNEILNGVFVSSCQWEQWMSGTKSELTDAYKHWAKLRGWTTTGII